MQYIHYGSDHLNRNKQLMPSTHYNKPSGLWASPTNSKQGWREWCLSECFRLHTLDKHFEFDISKTAKILHVFSEKDISPYLEDLFSDIPLKGAISKRLNETKLYKEYDGMELHLSLNPGLRFGFFYGWDCDSICIWNMDVVITGDKENSLTPAVRIAV